MKTNVMFPPLGHGISKYFIAFEAYPISKKKLNADVKNQTPVILQHNIHMSDFACFAVRKTHSSTMGDFHKACTRLDSRLQLILLYHIPQKFSQKWRCPTIGLPPSSLDPLPCYGSIIGAAGITLRSSPMVGFSNHDLDGGRAPNVFPPRLSVWFTENITILSFADVK